MRFDEINLEKPLKLERDQDFVGSLAEEAASHSCPAGGTANDAATAASLFKSAIARAQVANLSADLPRNIGSDDRFARVSSERVCFGCGRPGHKKAHCPLSGSSPLRGQGQLQSQLVELSAKEAGARDALKEMAADNAELREGARPIIINTAAPPASDPKPVLPVDIEENTFPIDLGLPIERQVVEQLARPRGFTVFKPGPIWSNALFVGQTAFDIVRLAVVGGSAWHTCAAVWKAGRALFNVIPSVFVANGWRFQMTLVSAAVRLPSSGLAWNIGAAAALYAAHKLCARVSDWVHDSAEEPRPVIQMELRHRYPLQLPPPPPPAAAKLRQADPRPELCQVGPIMRAKSRCEVREVRTLMFMHPWLIAVLPRAVSFWWARTKAQKSVVPEVLDLGEDCVVATREYEVNLVFLAEILAYTAQKGTMEERLAGIETYYVRINGVLNEYTEGINDVRYRTAQNALIAAYIITLAVAQQEQRTVEVLKAVARDASIPNPAARARLNQ